MLRVLSFSGAIQLQPFGLLRHEKIRSEAVDEFDI
jgi:hypothetical protein